MFGKIKKSLIVALAAGALAFYARSASADTITVSDNSHDTATGVYTYSIGFVNKPHVESNDGFVIYDFVGFTGVWTLTGGLSASQFVMSVEATSNTLNSSVNVDASGSNAASGASLPFNNVNNVQFSYVGPPLPDTTVSSAILTLHTSVLGSDSVGEYASVDHSSTANDLINLNDGLITIPAGSIPLPGSFWAGSLMFVLLAGHRAFKSRAVVA